MDARWPAWLKRNHPQRQWCCSPVGVRWWRRSAACRRLWTLFSANHLGITNCVNCFEIPPKWSKRNAQR